MSDLVSPSSDTTVSSLVATNQVSDSDSIGLDGQSQDAMGSVSKAITPTPTTGPASTVNTDVDHLGDSAMLQSSYGKDEVSDSSQFPMQHATQALPDTTSTTGVPVTDFSTSVAVDNQVTTDSVASQSLFTSDTVSVSDQPKSSVSDSVKVQSSVSSKSVSSVSDSKYDDQNVTSEYEPDVTSTDSATPFQSVDHKSGAHDSKSPVISVTPVMTTGTQQHESILSSSSVSYEATSRELFSTMTPSETAWSTKPSVDTNSFKTTPVVPLTPPTLKPTVSSDGDATSLFGAGGPSNMVLFVAVPLCALGILILLIVLIVCLKRRKNKQKGKKQSSPGRGYVQDLWVNSQPEIPLTSQDPLVDSSGRNALGNHNGVSAKDKSMPESSNETDNDEDNGDEYDEDDNIDNDDNWESVAESAKWDSSQRELVGKPVYDVGEGDGSCEENEDENDKDDDDDDGCTTYEAVYDFPAKVETHMSLKCGDIVHVHRKEDTGWWCGSIGEQRGWFPSNYVQAAPQDKCETENETDEALNGGNVSSFMVKRRGDDLRNSQFTEEEIQAEPIYCKIQPKTKRITDKNQQQNVGPVKLPPLINKENTPIPIDGETFVAVYPYTGHFAGELNLENGDIILGREKDRNGWMHGVKQANGEEGWFPAVYVDEYKLEEQPTAPDPSAYKTLEKNKEDDSKQDLVGIMHRAVHTFTAEKAGDLSFEDGETIAVFQVLESGWWLGCKGDTVGWFPGSFVEMIDQPSVNKQDPPESVEEISKLDDSSQNSSDDSLVAANVNGKSPRPKPNRKAPPPPSEPAKNLSPSSTGGSRIPKFNRPGRPAPPPPPPPGGATVPPVTDKIGEGNIHITKADVQVDSNSENSFSQDMSSPVGSPVKKAKPDVPQRFIKPTLVTIPRTKVNLTDSDNSSRSKSRPPPPPRPNAPRLGPVRAKLQAPKDPRSSSQSEDENESFFTITPQRPFDTDINFDRSDSEEADPYQRLSTFGRPNNESQNSTPLSTFGAPRNLPSPTSDYNRMYAVPQVTQADVDTETPPSDITNTGSVSPLTPEPLSNYPTHSEQNNKQAPSDGPNEENTTLEEFKGDNSPTEPKHDTTITKPQEVLSKLRKPKSKLSPPKHINLKTNTESSAVEDVEVVNSKVSPKVVTPTVSRIPRLPVSEPPVSKIPTNRQDSPPKTQRQNVTPQDINEPPCWDQNSNVSPDVSNTKEMYNDANVAKSDVQEPSSPGFGSENILDISNGSIQMESDDERRSRSDSYDKPPVAPKPKQKSLPKLLPKPKANAKQNVLQPDSPDGAAPSTDPFPVTPSISEPEEPQRTSPEPRPVEKKKIPQGSRIAQKSPMLKGKKSQIPASPHMKKKEQVKDEKQSPAARTTSESDGEATTPVGVDLKTRSESPASGRKGIPQRNRSTNSESSPSLRNRSNSPHSRIGIPSSITRQRSNSPASKLPKVSGIPAPSGKAGKSKKNSTGEKKIPTPHSEPSTPSGPTASPSPSATNGETPGPISPDLNEEENFSSPKPQRPSKPPRQNSVEGKSPRVGKSLLPVIHKVAAESSSPNPGKAKRGIPVSKPPRPPAAKSPTVTDERSSPMRTLFQAVTSYTAQSDGELSFNEGTFIKELSDCDRPGWRVGMLADGTTGIYPAHLLQPSPVCAQSEA